jgi:hypothetical protein
MPFIVTTKREVDQPLVKISGTATPQPGFFPKYEVESRRAVATLEAAQRSIGTVLLATVDPGPAYEAARQQVAALTESGGSVGPLPDRTVIEVEPILGGMLALAAGFAVDAYGHCETPQAEIIAAYNAKQETKPCPECGGSGVSPTETGERCIICKGRAAHA